MAKYVVLRKFSPELIEDEMNIYVEKGYELSQFVVKSKPCRVYIAVMELCAPKRINLEPMVG